MTPRRLLAFGFFVSAAWLAAGCSLIAAPDPDLLEGGRGGAHQGGSNNGGGGAGGTGAVGGAGGSGGIAGGGGTGGGCTTADECPGTDSECAQRTCENGSCGMDFTIQGTPISNQIAGDCKKAVCDGDGAVESVDDDNDTEDDFNECTSDVCDAGTPSHPALPLDAPCGTGLHCDGAGACVGCNAPAQCSGTDDECKTRTCSNHTCGFSFTPDGTAVASQMAGDCLVDQCDGLGHVATVSDDLDLPVDNIDCTDDICTNGVPSNPDSSEGLSCNDNGGSLCDGSGSCVECTLPSHCTGVDNECQTPVCTANSCDLAFEAAGTPGVPPLTQTSGACKKEVCDGAGAGATVNDDTELPDDSNPCTNDVCTNGVPSHTNVGSGVSCGPGLVCDGAGACVGCNVPADCPGSDTSCRTRTCVAQVCGFAFQPNGSPGVPPLAQTSGACRADVCDGAGNAIIVNDNADLPADGIQCTADVCTIGVPSNPPEPSGFACSQSGTVCDGLGDCVACNTAADCPGTDNECQTRTCTNHTCGFNFQPSGSPGSPPLSQTSHDCKVRVCNGAGVPIVSNDGTDLPVDNNACTDDVCSSGVPSNPAFPSGTTCPGGLCDGSGLCVECNVASDCPGTDNGCQVRTCTNHTCGMNFQPNGSLGSPALSQTAADCQRNVCNGSGATISIADNADVPPADGNECTSDTCSNGSPYPPVALGTPTSSQTPADCLKNVCDGAGNVTTINDNADIHDDGNECTANLCTNGMMDHPPLAFGTPVAGQTGGDCQLRVCDGAGTITSVADNADTPPSDGNECTIDVCVSGVPYPPVASGTPTSVQVGQDCHQNVCNGSGSVVNAVDDADIPGPDGNECTLDGCTAGVPYPPIASGTPTTAQTPQDCQINVCNGSGGIISVADNTDIHDDGLECTANLCVGGVMDHPPLASGTPIASQTANDCKLNVCDGAGGTTTQTDNADLPVDDGNTCTSEACVAGVPSHPNKTIGSSCTTNGNACNGAGSCVRTFMVLRVGDGSAALGSGATPSFIEERLYDGSLFGTSNNPIALPTTTSGANARLTNAGSSTSEGNLTLSQDGRYVVVAGYDAAVGTATVASTATASVNRIIGRVDRNYTIDTSTRLTTAFTGSNIRGACSSNGTDLWASGTSTAAVGGMFYAALGTSGGTQVLAAPNNARFCNVFNGQLYGSASSSPFFSLFSVGVGLPTTTGQTGTTLSGLPSALGPSVYGFVILDIDNNGVVDTLYFADDRTAATGGIYKYTSTDGVTWAAGTPAVTNVGATNGARGLAGVFFGGSVTLFATTTSNTIVSAVDPLTGAAMTKTTLNTAATNTAYRGIAPGVH
ncbi:MAG: hypothetical protein U0271_45675 [Polyangiaceae bacterium]